MELQWSLLMFHDISGLLAVFEHSPTLLADNLHFATDLEGCRDSEIRRRADATGRLCHTLIHGGHGSHVLHTRDSRVILM
jgi:hypothetical protein